MTRGGHYLHDNLLDDTVAVSLLFSSTSLPPTNAFHNTVLQMFVARRVQRIMERWEQELRRYCRQPNQVKWALNTEPVAPAWPEQHTVTEDDMGLAVDWFAMLYLVRYVAPSRLDHEVDRLHFAEEQVANTVEKAQLFVGFWTKRVRSTDFAVAIAATARNMMLLANGNLEDIDEFPDYWQPADGAEYPPTL